MQAGWIWHFFLTTEVLQLHIKIPAEWVNMILMKLHHTHTHTHTQNASVFNQLVQVKHAEYQEEVVNLSGRNIFLFLICSSHFYFILAYRNPVARITGIQTMFSEVNCPCLSIWNSCKTRGAQMSFQTAPCRNAYDLSYTMGVCFAFLDWNLLGLWVLLGPQ